MNNTSDHRKAIVKAIVSGIRLVKLSLKSTNELAFDPNCRFECDVTGLMFPRKLSKKVIVAAQNGYLWGGLWLDNEIEIDVRGHGFVLFPRWLAEVLREETDFEIDDDDIYDDEE